MQNNIQCKSFVSHKAYANLLSTRSPQKGTTMWQLTFKLVMQPEDMLAWARAQMKAAPDAFTLITEQHFQHGPTVVATAEYQHILAPLLAALADAGDGLEYAHWTQARIPASAPSARPLNQGKAAQYAAAMSAQDWQPGPATVTVDLAPDDAPSRWALRVHPHPADRTHVEEDVSDAALLDPRLRKEPAAEDGALVLTAYHKHPLLTVQANLTEGWDLDRLELIRLPTSTVAS